MVDNFTVFLTGKAKFKKSTTEGKIFNFVTLAVEIDLHTETILQAECTLSSNLQVRYIANLLQGKKLSDEGFLALYQEVDEKIFGANKNSVLAALNDLKCNWDRYYLLEQSNN